MAIPLPKTTDIMLTLPYLQEILTGRLPGVDNTEEQVLESAAGYDGIVELIQNSGLAVAVVLEHNEVGNFSFRPGGFHQSSQSIWIMEMVAADEDRRTIQNHCFASVKHLLATLKDHREEDVNDELDGWDWTDIPYGVRNAGPNYTGYEVTLYFKEDTDLSGLREDGDDNEEE